MTTDPGSVMGIQTKRGVAVLAAEVRWRDGYENAPDLAFLLDRDLRFERYDKQACMREQVSSEQAAIVGSRMRDDRSQGWHLYWSEDDGFAWFFTWGGKPDDGFGGWRRTITLIDGTDEEVVGGWHVGSSAAEAVGHPATVDVTVCTDYMTICGEQCLAGGLGRFITEERFRREVERLLPDVEVVRTSRGKLTVKWRGQPSKEEFMAGERGRRDLMRDRLKADYGDSWNWFRTVPHEEYAELECRPYSALGMP